MSGSVNKVTLVGNVGREPETRRVNNGEAVVSFSIATSEHWRDKASGERKERTEWHNVVIFNENIGKVAEQYVRKGSKVFIEGQLQTRKFQDKNGVERQTTEVVLQRFRGELVLLSGFAEKEDNAPDPVPQPVEDSAKTEARFRQSVKQHFPGDLDDTIPFAPEVR